MENIFNKPSDLGIDFYGTLLKKDYALPTDTDVDVEEVEDGVVEEGGDVTNAEDVLAIGQDVKEEVQASTDEVSLEDEIRTFAQVLADDGFIVDLPEGVNLDTFSLDDFKTTIKHNLDRREQEAYTNGGKAQVQQLQSALPPMVIQLMNYSLDNPNSSDEDIADYYERIHYNNQVKSLDVTDEADAEVLIKEAMRLEGISDADIAEDIDLWKSNGQLLRVAERMKKKVESIIAQKDRERREREQEIKAVDEQRKNSLKERATNLLSKGTLNGVELTKDEVQFLMYTVLNDNTPVPVKGGKNVTLGYSEALTYVNKYDERGSLENFMLSQLVLKFGPQAIEKFFAKKAKTAETIRFVKEHKHADAGRTGDVPAKQITTSNKLKIDFSRSLK